MRQRALAAVLIASLAGWELPSQTASFVSIPASAFTPVETQGTRGGYGGNETGTARSFSNQTFGMLAPVQLPHLSTVTSMSCGGRDAGPNVLVKFTLRRNEAQQANVDMAVLSTTFEQTGFQFLNSSSITQPLINNQRFSYYIVAETRHSDVGFCPECAVGFCRIGFTNP